MKLKMGVIGLGLAWDRLHYPALAELSEKYEIAAVCNKTIDKATGFASRINLPRESIYSDYREMLKREDLDVIDVLVPISENFEVARDVLLAGKNLIAEKPLAATFQGAWQLIELKNKLNLKVMVAENFRHEEFSTIIRDVISSGEIGNIAYFILNTGADFEKDMTGDNFAAKEWRQHPSFEGGIFLDGGIHDIALMRFLFGESDSVCALAASQDKSYCPYRNINTLIKFKSGVIGNYSYFSPSAELQKPPVGLRIFGDAGEIYLESKECGVVYVNTRDGQQKRIPFMPGRGYYNELLSFADDKIIATPEQALSDMELLFEILKRVEV